MGSHFAWYFLSLKGRISRQEFWLGYGATIVVAFILKWKLEDLFVYMRRPATGVWYRADLELALALPKILAAAIVLWPLIAIYVKRLHDLNLTGWWLLGLITIHAIAMVIIPDAWIVIFLSNVVIGLIPGTRGGNRFGVDPRAQIPA
jgi:uncharacterized membrane protein YhaH (DUF805 family)